MTHITLTPEQVWVVQLPVDSRCLVVADAGTGKTDVLVERLAHLIDHEVLAPGSEILVLSFSRAAVGEIRRRVRTREDHVVQVQAATFDSFATALLSGLDPEGSWREEGYEGRIAAAVDLIESSDAARMRLSGYRHILVDEIQDLVDARDDLVRTVLTNHGGGFTLLGDPAQAIYGWRSSRKDREEEGNLFEWVRSYFGSELEEHRLSVNFRARSESAGLARDVGKALNEQQPDYRLAASRLLAMCRGLPSLGSLASASLVLRRRRGTTALLCRTNGQALLVSGELRRRGVPHALQPRATDQAIAPWIGRLFLGVDGLRMGRRAFDQMIEVRVDDRLPPAEEAWWALKRLDVGQRDVLDVTNVARRIRMRQVPDELIHVPSERVTVSTIHRAKGLEFDAVALATPSDFREEDERSLAEESRVLYVGLTRAREDLYTFSPPEVGPISLDRIVDRWVHSGWNRWQREGIEIRGDDVDALHPAGSFIVEESATDIQAYMWDHVAPGDAVVLTLERRSPVGLPRAYYGVRHGDRLIGLTSEAFASDLHTVLKRGRESAVEWPVTIENTYVEGLDTVAGTSAAGSNADLGSSGIWTRCRIAGMGRFVFDDEGADRK